MILKLIKWYSLDKFEQAEDRRMARILLSIIHVYWFASLFIVFVDFIWWDRRLILPLLLGSGFQFVSFILLLQKKLLPSSFMSIGIYIFITTAAASTSGGIYDYAMMMYPIIILFAGLTAQQRGLLFSTVLVIVSLAWLTFGELYGWFIINKFHIPDWKDLLIASVLILIVVWAVYILVSNAQYGLTQTWRELAERMRAEEALKNSQTHLQALTDATQQSFVLMDRDANIQSFNRTATRNARVVFGEDMQEGDSMLKFILENERPQFVEDFNKALCGEIVAVEKLLASFIWREHWVSLTYNPAHTKDGSIIGVCLNTIDITERKHAENALHESEQRFRILVNSMEDIVYTLDLEQRYTGVYGQWIGKLGVKPEFFLGKTMSDVWGHQTARLHEIANAQALAGETAVYEWALSSFVREPQYYETSLSPLKNSEGSIVGLTGLGRNITEQRRHEAILHMRLKLLELSVTCTTDEIMQKALDEICLFTNSAIGFYHFVEPDQKTLSLQAWSTRTLNEFCKAEGKNMHYDIDQAGVWVDCIRQRRPIIHNDYASLSNRKGLPPGHAEVVRELVVPVYRSENVVCILGIGNKSTDYTEKDVESASYIADVLWEIVKRKQMEQSLRDVQSRLHLLGENLEEAMLYVYSHDAIGEPHFEYLSASMETLTGVKAEDAIQDSSNMFSIILPEYLSGLIELEAKSKEDMASFETEVRLRHAVSGEIRWALLRSTPRRRPDGSTVWYGVQMDITERKRDEKLLEEANEQLRVHVEEIEHLQVELREQALHDPLTGLYNRRYLSETMEREIKRMEREKNALSIIAMDIDYFKKINDTHGHQVGDKFLMEIASLLKKRVRGSDFICRYGGEEFLMVLPGVTTLSAQKRAEEIRRKCSEVIIQHDGKSLKVTMSFGVATYPVHGQKADEIIIKADKAMYKSKRSGRNKVTISDDIV